LLRDGDFDTWLVGDFRDWLYGIKTGSLDISADEFEERRLEAESKIEEAYRQAPPRSVDYRWLEQFLQKAYLTSV
jgi:hypothetical protein